jgi:hypothetical protein
MVYLPQHSENTLPSPSDLRQHWSPKAAFLYASKVLRQFDAYKGEQIGEIERSCMSRSLDY